MANPTVVADFHRKLEKLMKRLNTFDKSDKLWNSDETGLAYIKKSSKISRVSSWEKYVYHRTWGERGDTHTVLASAFVDSTWIPFHKFKGTRWSDHLVKINCQIQ